MSTATALEACTALGIEKRVMRIAMHGHPGLEKRDSEQFVLKFLTVPLFEVLPDV
jgi:hypothetical protein